jgi:hypothetical protein
MKKPKQVHVKMYDGRVLVGTVCAVEKTVSGVKVRVLSGNLLVTINADRIFRVVKKYARLK